MTDLIFRSGVGTLNLFGSYASDAAFVTANGTAINGYAYYNTTANTVRAYVNSAWIDLQADPFNPSLLHNLSISTAVAANALTISFKDAAGNALSASSPAVVAFRNGTATTGTYSYVSASSIADLTIPSGTSIGTSNGVPAYIYVYLINNGGTLEGACSIFGGFDEAQLQSSTAISGGSSATTLYSTSARASKAARLVGRIQISEATAGTWATAPTEVSPWPFRTQKQLVIGTPITSNGTTSSATFAAFSTNNCTVTLTAIRTGVFKIWGNLITSSSLAGGGMSIRIVASSGSPTVLFSHEPYIENSASTNTAFSYTNTPYTLVQLTAGSTYTFRTEGKVSSGTMSLAPAGVTNGLALIAEEL